MGIDMGINMEEVILLDEEIKGKKKKLLDIVFSGKYETSSEKMDALRLAHPYMGYEEFAVRIFEEKYGDILKKKEWDGMVSGESDISHDVYKKHGYEKYHVICDEVYLYNEDINRYEDVDFIDLLEVSYDENIRANGTSQFLVLTSRGSEHRMYIGFDELVSVIFDWCSKNRKCGCNYDW